MGDESTRLAEAILEFRSAREDVFHTGMFGETAWEFLLALFVADSYGRSTTGRAIAQQIKAPPASASRWLKFLASEGLVDGDGTGDLDDRLTISPLAVERMEYLLGEAKVLKAALLPDL